MALSTTFTQYAPEINSPPVLHRFEDTCRGQSLRPLITVIYSLGHGLHTLTAVPRLTQFSTLRGTVK